MSLLRCVVSPGQFSNEYSVGVQAFNGREFSLFASRSDVQCSAAPTSDRVEEGWLRVVVVERGPRNALVELPQSTLEGGRRMSVRPGRLR